MVLLYNTSLLVYLRVSCALLTPSVGSRASRLSLARHPHSCSISGSCWTRASSTSLSLWSCADPSFSRAANSFWRNGWRRTRYVEDVAGEMVISTHTHKSLFLCTHVCVFVREAQGTGCALRMCFFPPTNRKNASIFLWQRRGLCENRLCGLWERPCLCVNVCVCYLRCLL